jgi:peptide/nickel transport system substrate-binding protein
MTRVLSLLTLLPLATATLTAQHPGGTVVYASGQEPTLPLPVIGQGQGNADVADQLFLRLAVLTPPYRTAGDNALKPMLASAWHRVDARTIDFTIDPRARWQDGVPVTAHDVVFTWSLETNPAVNSDQATLEPIASVAETGPRTVRVTFKRPFSEQLYLFAFGMQPLPAHLLERVRPDSIATSAFAQHPMGDGPFRFERRVPGQLVELRADSTFFLGKPAIGRVLFTYIADATARLNQLLTGQTDVMDNVAPTMADQIQAHADLRFVTAPSSTLIYALFNTRSSTDTAAPNPRLADPRVREALLLALDRDALARSAFGQAARVPEAAQSQLWGWITTGTTVGVKQDVARARALLAAAGWRAGADGTLARNGVPLALTLIYPSTSGARHTIAVAAQQMWQAVGVHVELEPAAFDAYQARRHSGQWDIDLAAVMQDASPATLVESWSCAAAHQAASSNVARWCDPEFDRLLHAATTAPDPVPAWRAVLARMTSQHPAIFLAAPVNLVAVNTRYDNVAVLPVRQWLALWQWRVRPGAELARDR